MPLSDFMSLLHAQPFRPFRVNTVNGITFDITQAQQVGVSPGLRLIVVAVADNRFEMLIPEQIGPCEVITGAMPAAPPAPPIVADVDLGLSPGEIQFLAFTGKDGRGLVQFNVADRDGKPILSSAGTRWDVHGLETFENGRSLYIHHADDPTRLKRIIVWPPDKATFESFAEAMTPQAFRAELQKLDAAATKNPKEPAPAKDYTRSVKKIEPYIPPKPRNTGREEEIPQELRFEVEFEEHDAARNHVINTPRLVDTYNDAPMLDLTRTQWDATHEREGTRITLSLRHFPDGDKSLDIRTEPMTGMATVNGSELPLTILERHLINYELYDDWDALRAAIAIKPAIAPKARAEVMLKGPAASTIELWPGDSAVALPFMQMRILNAAGRAILDTRGSMWTALIERSDEAITLELINGDPDERSEIPLRIQINPVSHRVTSEFIPGSTALAALQPAIHQCRTASWMLEELQELFARGKDLPLP